MRLFPSMELVKTNSLSIVLCPGLDGTGLSFVPLVRALPPWLKPIVVRYPGDRHLDYSQLLPLILDSLPKNDRFIILGESFSGPLALMAAATKPAELLGVVLCATFVSGPRRILGKFCWPLVQSWPFQMYGPCKRVRLAMSDRGVEKRQTILDEMLRLVTPQVLALRLRMVLKCDATQALRDCEVPIQYLQGTRDWVVPARNLKRIKSIRPDVSAVRISAPHMVLQRNPADATTAIASFARLLMQSKQ